MGLYPRDDTHDDGYLAYSSTPASDPAAALLDRPLGEIRRTLKRHITHQLYRTLTTTMAT